jgi:hypothetical protein
MCEEAPADKFLYGNAVDQNACPLASLKMFISKTDPNAKSLFNRCIKDLNVKTGFFALSFKYALISCKS